MRKREAAGPRPAVALTLATAVGVLVGSMMAWRTPVATAQAVPEAVEATEPVPGVAPELVEQLAEISVRVEASRCDGPVQGSGVLLDDGSVVTNRHVLGDTTGARVVLNDGSVRPVEEYRVQHVEDLAVAKVGNDSDGTDGVDPLPAPVEPGQLIIVAGFPGGAPLQVDTGRALGWVDGRNYGVGPTELLLTDVDVIGGSSGSGVFNPDGRLLGVVVSRDVSTGGAVVIPAAQLEVPNRSTPVGWRLC
ncbi:MAG: serine protease [Microthrixaceae bacterium]